MEDSRAKPTYIPKTTKAATWNPDIHYAKTLEEIKNQKTPAELYRHKLDTIGRHARNMQRLEWRWSQNLPLWVSTKRRLLSIRVIAYFQTKSATAVKAGWRGMKGRIYFKSIKADLVVKREQREAKLNASALFAEGKIHQAVQVLTSVKPENMLPSLLFMKSQFYYQLDEWKLCIDVCRKGIGASNKICVFFERVMLFLKDMLSMPEQAKPRYMLSCALVKQSLYAEAFEELSVLIAVCDPLYDAYKLRAYIGFEKLRPPKYEQALLDLFYLLSVFPADLDLVVFHMYSIL
jgi:hypothetical protein